MERETRAYNGRQVLEDDRLRILDRIYEELSFSARQKNDIPIDELQEASDINKEEQRELQVKQLNDEYFSKEIDELAWKGTEDSTQNLTEN